MAPEIHNKQPYLGYQVDLFAAAVILFVMVTGHPPFGKAEVADPYYKCIAANRGDLFWTTHSKRWPPNFVSAELRELLTGMLQVDKMHRPSISEVLGHRWMQGPMPSYE